MYWRQFQQFLVLMLIGAGAGIIYYSQTKDLGLALMISATVMAICCIPISFWEYIVKPWQARRERKSK